MTRLPVLAFWQPWATLCVANDPKWDGAAKVSETRPWKPRNPLPFTVAIHAAKRYDKANRDAFTSEPFASTLRRCGFYPGDPRKLLQLDRSINGLKPVPLGAIIGTIEIFEVLTAEDWFHARHPYSTWEVIERFTQEKEFGDYSAGRYAWLMRNPVMLERPIPFSGRQEALYELDERTQALVDEQLAGTPSRIATQAAVGLASSEGRTPVAP